nr:hypothetical protein Iba_chr11eCG16100 [Ipomoea batatas]
MEIWIAFIPLLTSASVSPIRTFKRDTCGVTLASSTRITASIVEDDPINHHRQSFDFPFSSKHIGRKFKLILFHHRRIAATSSPFRTPIPRHPSQRKINVAGQDRNVSGLATPDSRARPIRHILQAVTRRYTACLVRQPFVAPGDSGDRVAPDSNELIGGLINVESCGPCKWLRRAINGGSGAIDEEIAV